MCTCIKSLFITSCYINIHMYMYMTCIPVLQDGAFIQVYMYMYMTCIPVLQDGALIYILYNYSFIVFHLPIRLSNCNLNMLCVSFNMRISSC